MVPERCLLLRPGEELSTNVQTRSLPPENVFCRPSQNHDPLMLKLLPTLLNYLKARGSDWDAVRKRPSLLCLRRSWPHGAAGFPRLHPRASHLASGLVANVQRPTASR